jgi:hypothetical protein
MRARGRAVDSTQTIGGESEEESKTTRGDWLKAKSFK